MRRMTIAIVGCLAAARAFAADVEVESRIATVTVYRDRADVRRVSGPVHVAAGESRLRFSRLPLQIIDGSIRVSGAGSDGIRILDVAEDSPKAAAATETEEIERARFALEALEARAAGLNAGGTLLRAIHTSSQGDGADAFVRSLSDAAWLGGAVRVVVDEVGRNAQMTAESARLLQSQRERLQWLLAERDRAEGRLARGATVDLRADRAGVVELTLDYSVQGASWRPEYDVLVSDDLKRVELVCSAAVTQDSGEEWTDAEIHLSTGRPVHGLEVPHLGAWWLRSVITETSGTLRTLDSAHAKIRAIHTTAEAFSTHSGATSRGVRSSESASVSLKDEDVTAVLGALSTAFRVPDRQTLAAEGDTQRMHLRTISLETQIRHECAPRVSAEAYVVARAENTSEHPLLAGRSRVIMNDRFVGLGQLEDVAPGQEFTLALGVDPLVKVERKVVDRETAETHEQGREKIVIRFGVQNFRETPITLSLSDQVPLSAERDVEIHVRRIDPPQEPDEEGIVRWNLTVPAGGDARAELAYDARFPKGRRPPNL